MKGVQIESGLTPAKEKFAAAVAMGKSQSDAYREAFPHSRAWKPSTVYSKASHLAAEDKVRERIAEIMASAAKGSELEAEQLLRMHVEIATADTRELVQYRRVACRYCHGKGHRYQFTPAEMERAREKHEEKQAQAKGDPKPFDDKGGVGYSKKVDPHPDCPECHGDGIGEMLVHDTRKLSPVAAQLYEGVKLGKDGLEVKIRSRGESLTAIARHRGFFEKDNKVTVVSTSPEELDQKFGEKMRRAMERQQAVTARRREKAD